MLLALVLGLPALLLARKLELRTGFESLLPENKASVRELKRVGARTAGVSGLTIVIDGKDKKGLQNFGDALLPKLRALGPEWVGTAEDGVQAEQEFLRQRKALYLSTQKVQELHDRVEDRFEYEVHGSLSGDVPEPITRESIERELGIKKDKDGKEQPAAGPPFPDGYYMNAECTRLVVLIRTPVESGDLAKSAELQRKVREVVDATNPKSFDPAIVVGLTGDIITSAEQYGAVKNDLASVGAAGIAMILLVDFLFFLRFRAVAAMALAIGVGVLWTFGITRLAIGHLNTASGFLVSIVFGNGINFGILLRARYNEARREGLNLEDSLLLAYKGTWIPTLTVAAAASAGYISLATTSFRGFRDFGVIGGYGMLLTWLANYMFMGPLLVIFESIWRTEYKHDDKSAWGKILAITDRGVPFGAPFSWFSRFMPRAIAVIGIAAGIAAMVVSYRYVKKDPLEYDLSKLENDDLPNQSSASKLGEGITELTGRSGQDGMAIMTDRLDQVKPLVAELYKRKDAAMEKKPLFPPFSKVVSIFDFIPDDQAKKLELLAETRTRIYRVRELGKIKDDDWKAIEPYLPPKDLKEFGVDDLPERVARPFTEKDGTRGRIVYIVPAEGASVRNVTYLLAWADSYRETKLPNGDVIIGSGRAVIFADMLAGVIEESPKAIVLSFSMTALVVFLLFIRGKGGLRAATLVLCSLVIGIAWMGAAMALAHVKINFLNFIAIPITFGIGVDYAINVVHRWRLEGPGKVPQIVRETGGAVVLCSMTTTLGYLALLRSINAAVRSFGTAAVIGEATCLTVALVVLPAVLMWLDRGAARVKPEVVPVAEKREADEEAVA